ncbi:hypothetical protein TNCV_1008351 [Trichonephila clavipes]|nr:hypothetical protein TNCV_1008351 [Trichonephila clavipes]
MVAKQLAHHLMPVTTVNEQWPRIEDAWTAMSAHAIQSLSESMLKRKSVAIAARKGRGSRVVWATDRGWLCHEFEPSTTKDPPCWSAMHAKSVKS